MKKRIPLILIHGSLGSGKTTLVKKLTSFEVFKDSILIENEFANENIDSLIINNENKHQTFEISGQCICCSSGEELEKALEVIANENRDRNVILETTGVANSIQLIQKLFLNSNFLEDYQIVKNIILIDPLETNKEKLDELKADIKLADLVIINKADLVSLNIVEDYKRVIKGISPDSQILITQNSNVELEQLNLEATSQIEEIFLALYDDLSTNNIIHKQPTYAVYKSKDCINIKKVEEAIIRLQKDLAINLKRVKGYIFDGTKWWEIQATKHHIEKKIVNSTSANLNKLVFIGENINQKTISKFESLINEN